MGAGVENVKSFSLIVKIKKILKNKTTPLVTLGGQNLMLCDYTSMQMGLGFYKWHTFHI